MEKLKPYNISDDAEKIAVMRFDSAEFEMLKNRMNETRRSSVNYTANFTLLLHLEELANSAKVQNYNLECVVLKLHSSVDRVFRIEYEVI